MIHPSYVELMKVVNDGVEIGEEPVVNSRYSIVIAAAKRARQIMSGDEPMAEKKVCPKPLSITDEEALRRKGKRLYRRHRMKNNLKLLFVSLGCDKNLVDTEFMLGMLRDDGIEMTDDTQEADIIIVNTCCLSR